MKIYVVVAEKSFEIEEKAVKLLKELLRLDMMVRLAPDEISLRDLVEKAGL